MDLPANANIEDLLKEWDLHHLYDKFKEEKVSVEVLSILNSSHINKIFLNLPIGDQAKFEFNLKKWKENLANTKDVVEETHIFTTTPIINILNVLNNSMGGKDILKFFQKHEVLYEEQRSLLINVLTKYLETNGIECKISDCCEIEKQICSIFPTEKLEYYTNGKRGKIYNKLCNNRRIAKSILSRNENKPAENIIPEPEENVAFYIQCLRSDSVTADEYDIYWRKCAKLRFQQIKDAQQSTDIFRLWPEYTKPSVSQLIDIDFSLKLPMAKDFLERWTQFGDTILQLLKSKAPSAFVLKQLIDVETKDEESRTLTILWHIHHFFPPQQKIKVDATGAKYRKKFSILDSQKAFAILAESEEEMETKIKLLELQGRNIQPLLLVLGNFPEIKSIWIYFNRNRYPFLKIANAFDTVFKMFFVFDLKYPEESEIFYTFFQTFFYSISSQKKYLKISNISHDILALPK